jgi:hypothetical protein
MPSRQLYIIRIHLVPLNGEIKNCSATKRSESGRRRSCDHVPAIDTAQLTFVRPLTFLFECVGLVDFNALIFLAHDAVVVQIHVQPAVGCKRLISYGK